MFGMIASMLTAFYMFRLLFLTFFGEFRGTHEQEHHLHESPSSMTFPLIVLAMLSVVGGLLGLPEFWHMPNWMSNNLETIIVRKNPSTLNHETEWMLMGIAVLAAAVTIYLAYIIYRQKKTIPLKEGDKMPGLQTVIYNKYYVDEFYDAVIRKPLDVLSVAFHKFFDIQIIDGLVNGVGSTVKTMGSGIRLLQQGNIGFYIISMVIGIVFIILLTFLI
jgi:NADH-quinone oxidoreductase subunit L